MVQNPKIVELKFFAPKAVKVCIPVGYNGKNFSFHFKHYNLTIHVVNFFETFCTCSPSSLGQDLIFKIAKKNYLFLFGLPELEMANLGCFLRKMTFVL
jgi:hypothetical protein